MSESTLTILITDDDPDILRGTTLRLEVSGFKTITAASGRECINAALTHSPDAVLLDVRMPDIDGIEVLKTLKASPETRNLPVVMLSASIGDRQLALDSGAEYFISKPYNGPTLIQAIQKAIQAPPLDEIV